MEIHSLPVSKANRLTFKTRYPNDTDCTLCLCSMKNKLVIKLPCGHEFHEKCHDRLRDTSASYRYACPCCRSDIKHQIQRFKLYDICEEEFWYKFTNYLSSHGQENVIPIISNEQLDEYHNWIINGLSQEELDMINSESDMSEYDISSYDSDSDDYIEDAGVIESIIEVDCP